MKSAAFGGDRMDRVLVLAVGVGQKSEFYCCLACNKCKQFGKKVSDLTSS